MNEREIFIAARQKENAVDQAAFIDEACAGNSDLHQRVWTLLREHDRLGSFLESAGKPDQAAEWQKKLDESKQ